MRPPSQMLEVLNTIRESRDKTGSHESRTLAALEDIADRLELIAGMLALLASDRKLDSIHRESARENF